MTNVPTNSTSDPEEVELYPEQEVAKSSKAHINDWFKISIDGAVNRGNELRENKPAPIRPKVERPKMMTAGNPRSSRKLRKRNTLNSQNNTSQCECSYWPTSSNAESILLRKSYSQNKNFKLRKRNNGQTRCSTRTAVLAMPSKRHCLETWRTKSYLLPDFMIDRLKQHVMNERPVVEISDAINCFRRRKCRSNNKPKKVINNTLNKQMPVRCGAQAYSIIFAKKIAQKLSKPMNITLNSDLQRIYKVVNDDITEMTKGKRNIKGQQLEKSIQSDVSKKVTIWIAGILEDLQYKLLEEDLLELEEKEGPVLDCLDDVLDNVLDICLPKPPSVYMDESDYFDSFSTAESNQNEPPEDPDNQLTNEDYFKHEIFNIIDKFDQHSESLTLTDKEYFQNEINRTIDFLFKEHIIKLTDTEYFENEMYDILSMVWKETDSEVNKDNETNFSDTLSEDSERSKKVMFSVEMDNKENSESLRKTNETLHFNNEDEQNHVDGHTKRNIYFAEPNTHLLSNADELWPQDILSHHVLRPSASVTKSIISLGNLWERDEKYMTPSQTDASVNNLENSDEDGNLHDIEILKSITSLAKIMQDGEMITQHAGNIDISGKLLQDIEILKSITSLAKLLPDDEKKTLNEASHDITGKLNLIYAASQGEISKSIMSLVQILQNDENVEMLEEATAIIPQILNQLTENLTDANVTKSIATLLNVLRSNHALPPEDSNVSLIDKLALLNEEFVQNKEITKSIASLVRVLENDEEHIKTTEELDETDEADSVKLNGFLDVFVADKCDADSQTDQLKTLEIVVLEPTMIVGVDSNPSTDKGVEKEFFQKEIQDKVKNKILTEQAITDSMKNYSDLDDEWKVHLRTAPSWVAQRNAHGDPSEDSVPAKAILTQNDVRKWCKDLSKGYKNLEIWRDWLSSTCKEATSILKKKNANSGWTHKNAKNMIKLRNNISKDAALWHKMNKRTHDTFEHYRKYYGIHEIIIPTETKRRRCICRDKYYFTQYRNI